MSTSNAMGHTQGEFVAKQCVTKKKAINVTEPALRKMLSLLHDQKVYRGIRVKVLYNKGCYGKKYKIEYAEEKGKFDEVIAESCDEGVVRIFIDPKTLLAILGSTIDYVEEKFSSGFVFINPNEKGRCGCGKSFN